MVKPKAKNKYKTKKEIGKKLVMEELVIVV
jgi:hypothetical protein